MSEGWFLYAAIVAGGIAAAALVYGAYRLVGVIHAFVRRRVADRNWRALVSEARNDWHLVQEYTISCVWSDGDKPERPAGDTVLFAEENGLSERRVRIIHKSEGWPVGGMKTWAQLKAWEAKAEPRALKRPERELL